MHPAPDPDLIRKARWQRVLMLVVVNTLVLLVGLVASTDLRRLRTPGGTALRWVEAAVFGDCNDYLEFSVASSDSPETRSPSELCHDLRVATAQARRDELRIGLLLGATTGSGADREVMVTLTRDGKALPLQVHVVRHGGAWRVLRDTQTCASVGCA